MIIPFYFKKPKFGFGLSQEDEQSEVSALDLKSGDRVFSIASAGDMALSLLAHGAGEVHAIDIDINQLHLCRLKLAAVRAVEREQAIRFLGLMPDTPSHRQTVFSRLTRYLPEDSKKFWEQDPYHIATGPVWAGKYERYISLFVTAMRPLLGKSFRGFFECTSLSEQEQYFSTVFDKKLFRTIFNIAFHPRLYSKGGMDPKSLQYRRRSESLAAQYFRQFRQLCTSTLARENWLLQIHLLGRIISEDAVPAYLRREYYDIVRNNHSRLTFIHRDIFSFLQEHPDDSIDKAHLSNLPDWLSQEEFEAVMRLLIQKMKNGGKLVWRFLHIDRKVPDELANSIITDRELGLTLNARDKFSFYGLIPATIRK